ncbi:DUF6760 family protein [Nocardia terpenica]|uniref:DUF6760 family protein n=1 Tax=Nocardia terpenica TaxID=455432 RepID=UPI001EEB5AF7|nr:DUF6760 family protein [Nocardia terpenica]
MDQLYGEIAYVAYHFGWAHDTLLDLTHHERRRWVHAINDINTALNTAQTVRR